MTREHDECIKKGKIKPFSRGITLAPKELETAKSDLETARKTYKQDDFKVCVKDLVGLFLNVKNHGGLARVAPNVFITACEAGVTTD